VRKKLVLIKALVDTSAMESFINKLVVSQLRLPINPLPAPITCKAFDGTPGK
ncbi:hypothetical protein CROQUDRAFT_28952, partial [Cronartium quercuum f. sp. fusiforme G11]